MEDSSINTFDISTENYYFQLDQLIEKTEKEYSAADLPKELTSAEMLLREHEASRSKIKHLIDYSAEEGEEIVVRVRQQVSHSIVCSLEFSFIYLLRSFRKHI